MKEQFAPYSLRMMLAVKANKAFNPIDIGLLSADAVMVHTQFVAHLIKLFEEQMMYPQLFF